MYTRGQVVVEKRLDPWSYELGNTMDQAATIVFEFLETMVYQPPLTPVREWLEERYAHHPLLNIADLVEVTERHSPNTIDVGRRFTFCGYHPDSHVAFFWFLPHSTEDDGDSLRTLASELVLATPEDFVQERYYEMGFVLMQMPPQPQAMVEGTLLFPYASSLVDHHQLILPLHVQQEMIAAMNE